MDVLGFGHGHCACYEERVEGICCGEGGGIFSYDIVVYDSADGRVVEGLGAIGAGLRAK